MNEKNESTMTLEEQDYYKNSVAQATGIYSTALFSPSSIIKDTELGSGTFVIIGGVKGLLTNDHVAKIFIDKNLSYVHILYSAPDSKILQFENIIRIPALAPGVGVDLAFFALRPSAYEVIESLGKRFWDMDQSAQEHKPFTVDDSKAGIWVINGVVAEGKKRQYGVSTPPYNIIVVYKGGSNIVIPSTIEYGTCSYEAPINLMVTLDYITCPIQTKNKVPKSFCGLSGGALWKVIFKDKQIQNIILYGVATEYGPKEKAQFFKCRGPVTLFQVFYPFCLGILCGIANSKQ